ncbi:MAG: ATP-binding cassette domain-containing protein [Myxococcota bacterium]
MHKPIQLNNISLSFPHKTCFVGFSTQVHYGERIGIMGINGSGKSSLLKMLQGNLEPSEGSLAIPQDMRTGHVPQVIQTHTASSIPISSGPGNALGNPSIEQLDSLSGGQRFHEALTTALAADPNVLLLDEPTNHLDRSNRTSLMRMLRAYRGTLMIVSHDVELLRCCVDTLWHIHQEQVHAFSGSYDDYLREMESEHHAIIQELRRLDAQKKELHKKRMKQQQQAAKRKAYGEKKYDGDKLALRSAQGRGQATSNKNNKRTSDEKKSILKKLSQIRLPETIKPKFFFPSDHKTTKTLVSISEGSIGYDKPLLSSITLSLSGRCRIAVTGDNGSGKSTLIKAILGDTQVAKSGNWHVPHPQQIGYLDQHYNTLNVGKTVMETIQTCAPNWQLGHIRQHLNDFLFRKNEEVHALISTLSGGEKARLSLACIAAGTPRLLILDEITNNLDLTTRNHVIQILREYPNALIVISHDEDFLKQINISRFYHMKEKRLFLTPLPI